MRKILPLLLIAFGLLAETPIWAQTERVVSGTVLANDDNSPLIGVTVTNQRTQRKTSTNSAGYYSIAAEKGQTLIFTYIGFARKDIVVGDEKLVNVKMVPSDQDLGNVVVTGYGQARNKRELAYQAPTVKGEDLSQTRRENFLNGLAGRVPGLTVTSTSGLPGASAQVVLRGGISIGGNNQPLFVVDGVPLDNNSLNQESLVAASNPNATGFVNRNGDYTNRIADINPEDIESVTVLKGPEATSIYGSDGAGGAIVITTRKGTAGKARVYYDNSFAVTEVYRFPELQSTYSRGTNGVFNPSSYGSYGFLFFGPAYAPGTKVYDNLKEFFQTGRSQQHNLSVEAGTSTATLRFSTSYFTQTGVVPNSDFTRGNVRLTGSAKVGSKVNITSNFAYYTSTNSKPTKGVGSFYTNLMVWPTDVDAKDYVNPDGTRKTIRGLSDLSSEIDNPYWEVNKNRGFDKNNRVTGNLNISADPWKWLNLATIVGVDNYATQGYYYNHPLSRYGFATKGFLSTYNQNYTGYNGTVRGTIKKTFRNISNSLTVGAYFEDNKRTINAQRGERFFEPDFISINNTDPTSRDAKLTEDEVRKTRLFGSYVLGYNNLVYLTFAGTREGDSRFTSRFLNLQPYFNYGSVSGSFIFSDLRAFKQFGWLSLGKLRASYATSGKGPLVPYIVDYNFGNQITTGGGFAFGVTGNNFDLRPEFSKNFEFGGEFKFLKNRLGIDVAIFKNKITDQLLSTRLSYGTGFVIKWINGGELSAKGVEIQLTGTPIKSKNLNWDVTVNFDKARTRVEKMPADLPSYYDADTWLFGNVRSEVKVGSSLSNLMGNTFRRNSAGQLLISPTSGLPIRDAGFSSIGDRTPDFKVGIINNFTFFENLNLSFNLDLRKGGDVFNANQMMMVINGVSKSTLDREQPRVIEGVLQDGLENSATPTKNTISITPYYRNDFYNAAFAEEDYIENVNWLRLRDLTVAYRLPSKLMKRQKVLSGASLFVTGTDLFIITNYSGIDPNVNGLNAGNAKGFGGAGIDFGSIPMPRTINFGLKAQF